MRDNEYDILDGKNLELKCLDLGFVRLLDCMPRICPQGQTADFRIVQAARVSYGDGTKTVNEDTGLIRYLMRHRHSSPTEKVRFEFHIKLPLFCMGQLIRHRMSSVNQISARYSVMKDEFYFPELDNVRAISEKNKQVSEGAVDSKIGQEFLSSLHELCEYNYEHYEASLSNNISREQARMVLPQNLYTEFYWTIDLHNLLHFLALRADAHAQQEIQIYANAIIELIKQVVPITATAWDDYHPMRGGLLLSRLEVEALKHMLHQCYMGNKDIIAIESNNKREQQEWLDKIQLLGRS
jgi:thymidylate synthase (FAD)